MTKRTVLQSVVVLIVTLLVVGGSLLWNETVTRTGDRAPDSGSESSSLETYEWRNWDLPSEASLDVTDRTGQVELEEASGLTIPGKVQFISGDSETLELSVTIRPGESKILNRIQREQSDANLLTSLSNIPSSERNFQKPIEATVRTDETGKFKIHNAPPGLYRVTVNDAGWTGQTQHPLVETPESINPLQLRARPNADLVGTVTDQRGNPLPDARISYNRSGTELRTDDTGQFTLENIPPDSVSGKITINKNGYVPRKVNLPEVDPGATVKQTFHLQNQATLAVSVHTSTGIPLDQGAVRLTRLDDADPMGETNRSTESTLRPDGQTSFSSVTPGKYTLNLTAPKYYFEPTKITLEPGETRSLTLTTPRMDPVRISVIEESTGSPITVMPPDFSVYDAEGDTLTPGVFIRNLDGNGTLRGYIHPEMNRLEATLESDRLANSPRSFTIGRSDLPSVELPVELKNKTGQPDTAKGTLTLRGSPSSTGNVEFNEVELYVIDRQSGDLMLGRGGSPEVLESELSLVPGTYLLYGLVHPSDGEPRVFLESITMEPGESSVKRFELESPATLEGTLDYSDGNTATLRAGLLLSDPREESLSGTTGELYFPAPLQTNVGDDGTFRLTPVPPSVPLQLIISTTGETDSGHPAGTILTTETIRGLGAGEDRRLFTVRINPSQ